MQPWIAAASPFFRTVLPQYRADFDKFTEAPPWIGHIRVSSGGSMWDDQPRHDNFAEADAAEARDNSAAADTGKARLLAWLDSLLDLHRAEEMDPATALQASKFAAGRRVFVVHGHDDGARESVSRFLEHLDFTPVVLNEHANEGRTIIEKFEHHADVAFAIILLTPDDVGAPKSNSDRLRDRARQNVVLELGYFIGRLGRSRVCALHKGDLELPSDLHGVLYVAMDEGDGWKLRVAKEMKAAKLELDMNRAV